jgi:hypothetical protein
MNENPYHPPNACDVAAPRRGPRLRLHPLGLIILAVAVFFIHALATKVPAGALRIVGSPWLAAVLRSCRFLCSFSVLSLSSNAGASMDGRN